jgi:hypothetical protein
MLQTKERNAIWGVSNLRKNAKNAIMLLLHHLRLLQRGECFLPEGTLHITES